MSNVPPDQPGWPNQPQSQPPPGYGGPGDYGSQGGGGYPGQGGYGRPQPSNGIGIAAMVVGIVSVFLFWIPFLGVVIAIVALVLGIVGIRKASRGEATNKGMAIAGVVTGGLALLGGALITIGTIAFFDEFGSLVECVEEATTVEEERECERQFEDDFFD